MSLPMPTYIPSSRPGQIAELPWREVCPHCLTALNRLESYGLVAMPEERGQGWTITQAGLALCQSRPVVSRPGKRRLELMEDPDLRDPNPPEPDPEEIATPQPDEPTPATPPDEPEDHRALEDRFSADLMRAMRIEMDLAMVRTRLELPPSSASHAHLSQPGGRLAGIPDRDTVPHHRPGACP